MRRIFFIIVGMLLSPVVLYLIYGASLWLLGYELTHTPEKLVEKLIRERRPAKDCFLFRTLDIGPRPSTYQLQRSCIYTYAKLTQDPAACELLMPSEYGMSCLGAATEGPTCWRNYDKSIRWDNHGGESSLKDCQKKDSRRPEIGNMCCHIASVTFLKNVNDCSPVASKPEMLDECFDALAYKKLDPNVCTSIRNENLRIACSIRVSALANGPAFRARVFIPPVDSPD